MCGARTTYFVHCFFYKVSLLTTFGLFINLFEVNDIAYHISFLTFDLSQSQKHCKFDEFCVSIKKKFLKRTLILWATKKD